MLAAISVLGMCLAPVLAKLTVWGFANNPPKMQLTIQLTKLIFHFILFIYLAAFMLAVLNTLHFTLKFGLAFKI
jgi:putative peptidoglycan lipid II flippase